MGWSWDRICLKSRKYLPVLVECWYAGPGRISGSLKLTAEISRQSPRMCATFQGWSTSAMQTCKTEVEGLAKGQEDQDNLASHQQNIISLIMSLLSPRSSLSSSTSKNTPRVGKSTEGFAGRTKHLLNSGATRVSRFFIRSPSPSPASDHVLRRSNRCDATHPEIHSQRATALPVSCYNVPEILIGFDAA